ncbi:hypothetical protein ABIF35_000244 [Bradyrhizobium japonicum]|uniref:hypothetical protein n=1 Tax=Bradyrhizobium diazoefficiens TaxID=1355477 RepID=UPI00348A2306
MSTTNVVDTARLNLLLNELRLPAIKALWPQFAEQSDKEGWPAARFLATIAEHEIAERAGPGCLDSAPLDLSGFLPGYAERGALRFCRCVGRA